MKKVLLYGALGLGLVVLLVVAVSATLVSSQPEVIHVERTTTMAATVADVHPYTADFTKFVTWSPWSDLDPDQEVAFSDPPTGVGAWYSWKGDDQVGEGKMTLTAVQADRVVQDLEFIAPWQSQAEVGFTLESSGEGQVDVTWTYDQQADFTAKMMSLFMDMDEMLGPDYEKGLANLKAKAEADASARAEAERLAAEAAAEEGEGEEGAEASE